MAKRVFVNGYGSIGKRITAFISEDSQIDLIGVGKYSNDQGVLDAKSKGYNVYVPEAKLGNFENADISGSVESALDTCDLVIDASPGGTGYANKKNIYEPRNIPAIYQGGESTFGDNAVSDFLYNSRSNHKLAIGRKHAMQGSCNVTGMGKILQPLREKYGGQLVRFDVTLVRRWADIEQTEKIIPDTIEMTQKPHHANDVKAYMGKETPLFLRAIKVPTRQMHLHILDVRFSNMAPNPEAVHEIFTAELGVAVLQNAKGTQDVRKYADSLGYSFTDTNMVHIHANMTIAIGDTLQMMYSDDQTGIVIPENHMLAQAMLYERSYEEALSHTESLFHMAEKKSQLEKHFT